MGIFDYFRKRPPTQAEFAKMLLKRIRASGDRRPVEFDADGFRLLKEGERVIFLSNIFQEYLRATRDERTKLVRNFLATWYTSELPIPKEFDDAKADILPALRARAYFEIDLQLIQDKEFPPPPYEIVGEHLALSLVYDLPTAMKTVDDSDLERWGISFYEAMEVAKQNLSEKPTQFASLGSAFALATGDSYDATRLMSFDFIRHLTVPGDTIAMVPDRERLYIAGSDDIDGLSMMLNFAQEDMQHERYISAIAIRLEGDSWQPWLPEPTHPLYVDFRRLRVQTIGQMYTDQAALLNKRFEKNGTDLFVASFSGITDKSSGRLSSYCLWAEGVDSLLPETDEVVIARREGDSIAVAARAPWDTVRRAAGNLTEPQGMYPERWRVRCIPDASILAQIEAEKSAGQFIE